MTGFEDELEELILQLGAVRRRLDLRDPTDDREKLLREKVWLLELMGIAIEPGEELPALRYA